ncbi:MAG: PaaI family thioesterase [Nitriliruptoraceae bacterium]
MTSDDRATTAAGLLAGLRALGDGLAFNRHLGTRVLELEPGWAVTVLDERGELHNHLGGVHAIAELAPVELAGALAVTSRLASLLEQGQVPVVGELSARYLAPGRGRLTATAAVGEEAVAPALAALEDGRKPWVEVEVQVRDADDQAVVEARLTFVFVPAPAS